MEILESTTLGRLALAFGLGLLVGLQREWADTRVAGIRTFPLITLVGALTAVVADAYGDNGWILASGLLGITALAAFGNWLRVHTGAEDAGLTTEITMLLMFLVGALVVVGEPVHAVILAGAVAVLLQAKRPLHDAVDALGERDFHAITQFVLISLVILPLLPDRDFGPYAVLNPREVWWMVVLIVGIGLAGYLAYKFFGRNVGTLLGGVLGGMVSSTATSVSYARRSKEQPALSSLAAVVVMIASSVVFVRVLIEIGAVASGHFGALAPPIAAFGVICLLIAAMAFAWEQRKAGDLIGPAEEDEERTADDPREIDLGNPSELRSALVFGALYAIVLLAVAWAKDHLGRQGLYAVAFVSGLTDMDAITLSTSRLVRDGKVAEDTAWRVVVIASMSNFLFKGVVVATLGSAALRRRIAVLFGSALLAGGALLLLWPG